MFGVDDLIPGAGIGLAKKSDDLVGTRPADDPLRIEAVDVGDRLPQRRVIGRWIAVKLMDSAQEDLFRAFGRPEGVFVRTELHHVGHARDMRLTTLVKGDIKDARLWAYSFVHAGLRLSARF